MLAGHCPSGNRLLSSIYQFRRVWTVNPTSPTSSCIGLITNITSVWVYNIGSKNFYSCIFSCSMKICKFSVTTCYRDHCFACPPQAVIIVNYCHLDHRVKRTGPWSLITIASTPIRAPLSVHVSTRPPAVGLRKSLRIHAFFFRLARYGYCARTPLPRARLHRRGFAFRNVRAVIVNVASAVSAAAAGYFVCCLFTYAVAVITLIEVRMEALTSLQIPSFPVSRFYAEVVLCFSNVNVVMWRKVFFCDDVVVDAGVYLYFSRVTVVFVYHRW